MSGRYFLGDSSTLPFSEPPKRSFGLPGGFLLFVEFASAGGCRQDLDDEEK